MKRESKCLHNVCYLILAALTLFFCWLFCIRWGVFGAKVDWISQHSVIPDYFRKQFYETGQLFPEFAANLGGGQNIYNYSYYGLYSPLFLLSYVLPFVKMSTYVMVMEIICLIASILFMYIWLSKRGFGIVISFGTAVVFLLTGPMICQSYSQIMFVNYMPFLLLALMGVDRYFEKEKSGLLVMGTFLMIMTSFYFSIGGILALIIYGIHCYGRRLEERKKKATVRDFLVEGVKFLLPILIAVLMSGVLLVPTAFALLGRSVGETSGTGASAESVSTIIESGNVSEILKALFFPSLRLKGVFYSPYGLGFGTLMLTILIATMFCRKLSNCVMAWLVAIVSSVPIFVYILNGGLYLRDKALIPLIPLFCYMLAEYLKRISQSEFSWVGCIPYVVTMQLIYNGRNQEQVEQLWTLLMIESQIMLGCYLATGMFRELLGRVYRSCLPLKDQRKKWAVCGTTFILAGSMVLFLGLFNYEYSKEKQQMLNKTFYKQVTNPKIGNVIKKVTNMAKKEGGFYRSIQLGSDDENAANLNRIWNIDQYISSIYSSSYNEIYQNFRKNIFGLEQPYRNFLMQSEEPDLIYQRFMGERYVVSKTKVDGYQLLEKIGKWYIYENKNVAPIIYGTSQSMSEKEYDQLKYPYNQTVLLEKAIVPDSKENSDKVESRVDNLTPVTLVIGENSCISEKNGGYCVFAKKDTKVKAEIQNRLDNVGTVMENEDEKMAECGQEVLLLRFKVKNLKPTKDMTIWVNGTRNKLSANWHVYYNDNTTFTYVTTLAKNESQVDITFGKGKYDLSDIEAYVEKLPGTELYESPFEKNETMTKGNVIAGKLTMHSDGYMITSIPYDEGFEIQIDGKTVKSEKVNTAFLGCKVEEGMHQVVITYHAPGVMAGKIISIIGVFGFVIILTLKNKSGKFKKKVIMN